MSGDDNPKHGKSKTRKLFFLIFWLVILLALVLIVLSLVPGSRPGQSMLSQMLSLRAPSISVSEFNFEVGRDRVFAHSNGSIAAAGTFGLQVLGPDGQETLRHSFRSATPAIYENNGFFITYDIGGSSVYVFNSSGILSTVDASGLIVSASINKNGWFCIVTQERGSYRGTVSVYNSNGARVYEVKVGSGFVLSAELSPDNKNLAILSMADTGSQITYYGGIDSHKDEPDEIYRFGNRIVIDIKFIAGAEILAVSTQAVQFIDFSGNTRNNWQNLFEGKRLAGYTISDSYIAVHLYDYAIGYSGKITTISFDGTVVGEIESSFELVSMSSIKDTLVILQSDGSVFFDKYLNQFQAAETSVSVATAEHTLALSEDMALVANDHFAVVIRRGEDN